MDDAGLVTADLTGEERAFDETRHAIQDRLLNFVYRTIGDRERGEDLVQEVFVRVYRHLHRFESAKSFDMDLYNASTWRRKNCAIERAIRWSYPAIKQNWRMTIGRPVRRQRFAARRPLQEAAFA